MFAAGRSKHTDRKRMYAMCGIEIQYLFFVMGQVESGLLICSEFPQNESRVVAVY